MTRVKICGVTTPRDAVLCDAAGADLLGVILTGSLREVTPDQARAIRDAVPQARLVGVMRDGEAKRLARRAHIAGVDVIQLHDYADPDRWRAVATAADRPVLPAVTADHADLAIAGVAAAPDLPLEGLLFDLTKGRAATAADRDRLWDAARRAVAAGVTVFLAGSLGVREVASALARVRPHGLDVCRGTERAPGEKSPDLVRRFLAVVRSPEVNRAR
jgi:phosphoribosylanthranilate isomerase